MPDQLRECLNSILPECGCDPTAPRQTLHKIRKSANDSLSRLAELGALLIGAREVCEKLKIDEYAELDPLASHRYLAYLAREGVIREVITTNYDCCIERAFKESLPSGTDHGQYLASISSLEDYRSEAAKHMGPGHLLVYKINGCAETYKKQKASGCHRLWDDASSRIILTERQLQSFRSENWAQDLLRDRARTRSFLFSGFGSEEPQIRHSILTLLDEFSKVHKSHKPDEVKDLTNSPFLHSYESALSFYQLQILIGFLDAHSDPVFTKSRPESRVEPMFPNVFAGEKDSPLKSSKFKSSKFMSELFRYVFHELVRTQSVEGSIFAAWLKNYTQKYRLWLADFCETDGDESHLSEGMQKVLNQVLNSSNKEQQFPLPLWRLMHEMRYPGSKPPVGYYIPLREDALAILVTLLFLARFDPKTWGESSFGFFLRLAQNENHTLRIRFIHEDAVASAYEGNLGAWKGRLMRLIVIPSRLSRHTNGRWQIERGPPVDGEQDRRICGLWTGSWTLVSAGDLVAKAGQPDRLLDVLSECFAETRGRPAARLTEWNQSGDLA